jgi:predicted nucleic acid-binding protein
MTMAAILPDEVNADVALGVIERVTVEGAVVPSLWRIEVGNALLMAERRNVILPDEGIVIRSRLAALAIKTDDETNLHAWERTMELGKRHGLTLYDSTYLELALRLRLPLASLDKQLRRAASAEKVELL